MNQFTFINYQLDAWAFSRCVKEALQDMTKLVYWFNFHSLLQYHQLSICNPYNLQKCFLVWIFSLGYKNSISNQHHWDHAANKNVMIHQLWWTSHSSLKQNMRRLISLTSNVCSIKEDIWKVDGNICSPKRKLLLSMFWTHWCFAQCSSCFRLSASSLRAASLDLLRYCHHFLACCYDKEQK